MRWHATLLLNLAVYTFLILPVAPLWAQELSLPPDGDRIAPVIQYEPPSQSAPTGKPLSIEATITDNAEVLEAVLFYRPLGASEYATLPMDAVGPGRYRATIPEGQVTEPGVEYYIQASDKAGNMVMRGFAFSPLLVTVAPVLAPPAPSVKPAEVEPSKPLAERLAMRTEAEAKPWYKKWWVWAIAGGVVVAAAAAGGGGGGGGGDDTGAGGQTGTLTITGPTP